MWAPGQYGQPLQCCDMSVQMTIIDDLSLNVPVGSGGASKGNSERENIPAGWPVAFCWLASP